MIYKNLKILVYICKKPRSFNEITRKIKVSDEALNQLLSMKEMEGLYYATDTDYKNALYKVTFEGETVAQSEIDRLKEIFFSRTLSVIALAISVFSLAFNNQDFIKFVNRLLEWLQSL